MWRIERDTMGEVRVDARRLWGAQTQRALEGFPLTGDRLPAALICALARVKQAAARAHGALGALDPAVAGAIAEAAAEVAAGRHDEEFPLGIWQTGSGTQTHMNVNEVLANRASEILGAGRGDARRVHPNDHVNLGQSSNDVVPTAIHIATIDAFDTELLPAIGHLRDTIAGKALAWRDIVKVGRTHLMDAAPLPLGREVGAWAALLTRAWSRLQVARNDLLAVALGGTAVGTGLNAPEGFADTAIAELAALTGLPLVRAPDPFAALSLDDAPLAAHGAMKGLAVVLIKIANDLRLLGSGPRAGIAELRLPANEPGSSMMPGKVNPTQPEAVLQRAAQVIGNDAALTIGCSGAQGQLALARPHLAFLLLWSASLLGDGCRSLSDRCIEGLDADYARISALMQRSLMVVTALVPHIGYEAAARIAEYAASQDLTPREAAVTLGLVRREDYDAWVRPEVLAGLVRER